MKQTFTYHTSPFGYITSPLFEKHGIKHAFTTRCGGVSGGVYESLNFAAGTGEKPDGRENILKNHDIAASLFQMNKSDICKSYQTHSGNVEKVTRGDRGRGLTSPSFGHGVDGLVCKEEGVLLSVRGADCVTLILCDPKARVCGAVHSGWRGTAAKIAAKAVEKMTELGAKRENLLAAIGPSARVCCYRVGEELRETFISADPNFALCFKNRDDGLFLDLQMANAMVLTQAGIKDDHISDCGECSVCRPDRYFSHRRSGAERGTMAAFITN